MSDRKRLGVKDPTLIPTLGAPLATAWRAYSICTSFPLGLKVVREKLYLSDAMTYVSSFVWRDRKTSILESDLTSNFRSLVNVTTLLSISRLTQTHGDIPYLLLSFELIISLPALH